VLARLTLNLLYAKEPRFGFETLGKSTFAALGRNLKKPSDLAPAVCMTKIILWHGLLVYDSTSNMPYVADLLAHGRRKSAIAAQPTLLVTHVTFLRLRDFDGSSKSCLAKQCKKKSAMQLHAQSRLMLDDCAFRSMFTSLQMSLQMKQVRNAL